jgi:hypothetical protein
MYVSLLVNSRLSKREVRGNGGLAGLISLCCYIKYVYEFDQKHIRTGQLAYIHAKITC